MFYIHNNQLWNYHNASTIYPVHVVNATRSADMPLQLVVGTPRGDVVRGGFWRWQGTMLFYELGTASNGGVYYGCQNTEGLMGLFLFLRGSAPLLCRLCHMELIIRVPGRPLRRAVPSLRCTASCVAGSLARVDHRPFAAP